MSPREPIARHHFHFPRGVSKSALVDALLARINNALECSHLYILAKNELATLRMRLGVTADYLPVECRRAETSSKRWRNTAELSRDLARFAKSQCAPVLFVLILERFQVYDDDFQRYLQGFGIDSTTVDVEQPSRLLAREFAAESLRS